MTRFPPARAPGHEGVDRLREVVEVLKQLRVGSHRVADRRLEVGTIASYQERGGNGPSSLVSSGTGSTSRAGSPPRSPWREAGKATSAARWGATVRCAGPFQMALPSSTTRQILSSSTPPNRRSIEASKRKCRGGTCGSAQLNAPSQCVPVTASGVVPSTRFCVRRSTHSSRCTLCRTSDGALDVLPRGETASVGAVRRSSVRALPSLRTRRTAAGHPPDDLAAPADIAAHLRERRAADPAARAGLRIGGGARSAPSPASRRRRVARCATPTRLDGGPAGVAGSRYVRVGARQRGAARRGVRAARTHRPGALRSRGRARDLAARHRRPGGAPAAPRSRLGAHAALRRRALDPAGARCGADRERGLLAGDRRAARRARPAAHSGVARDAAAGAVDAVLLLEDQRFFEHHGVDPWRIGGAALANLRAGGIEQGGSTITQQLVRTVALSRERTLLRKLREAAGACCSTRASTSRRCSARI